MMILKEYGINLIVSGLCLRQSAYLCLNTLSFQDRPE